MNRYSQTTVNKRLALAAIFRFFFIAAAAIIPLFAPEKPANARALVVLALLDHAQPGTPAGDQPKRTKLKNKKPADTLPTSSQPAPPEAISTRDPISPNLADSARAAHPEWVIILAVFRGEDQDQAAATLLARIRVEGALPEAFIQHRSKATAIALGGFTDPNSPETHAALKRVQDTEVAGDHPYIGAYLAPPPFGDMPGALPQYNLLRARELYGAKALYTLQIGVYGRRDLDHPSESDLAEARRDAEQGAFRLRQDGELAFYHHGPRLSTVSVGVFDQTDFDPQTPSMKSQRLVEAQRRFPHNLYNGQAIRERIKGQEEGRLQPTNLVAIPKS